MIALALVAVIFHLASAFAETFGPEYLDMLRATGRDEEFAKIMGIADPKDVRPSNCEKVDDEILKNFGGKPVSELGDILLTDSQREQLYQGLLFPESKWTNNVIPYVISTVDFTASQRTKIERALQTLNNSMTNLKLKRYTSDRDYVFVFSGCGCFSYLGRKVGNQGISLQDGCLARPGIIQHEFIHAAGFLHEHTRPDRDNYVKVLLENIPNGKWRSQYKKAPSNEVGIQGPYDYYSVMHYGMKAPETNLPAFEVFDKTVQTERIGQRNGASEQDIRNIDKLYA